MRAGRDPPVCISALDDDPRPAIHEPDRSIAAGGEHRRGHGYRDETAVFLRRRQCLRAQRRPFAGEGRGEPRGARKARLDRSRPGNRHSSRAHRRPARRGRRLRAVAQAGAIRRTRRQAGRSIVRAAGSRARDRPASAAALGAGADVLGAGVSRPAVARARCDGAGRRVPSIDMRQVSVAQFLDDNRERLGLVWLAGRDGGDRMLVGESTLRPTIGQVGHMNLIHPFRVQILGAAELAYLRALPEDELNRSINRLFTTELAAIVVANGEQVPRHLLDMCNQHRIALVTSQQPSPHIVDVFRIYLSRVLAQSTTLHGVFLDVLELGVLITGASAIGKSELALELISRGNGLIADDIVELYRISPDTLEGRCPAVLKEFLEVRGIGILNIRTIFGETAVRPRKLLKLMVNLEDHSDEQFSELDRLQVDATYQEILGVPIRKVTIPVAAGRNLAVLVEAAVRNFVLNQRGIDSTKEFIERQQKLMEDGG